MATTDKADKELLLLIKGVREVPSGRYIALYRGDKKVFNLRDRDKSVSGINNLDRIRQQLESPLSPAGVYTIRYQPDLHSGNWESVEYTKGTGRINPSEVDGITKQSRKYQDINAENSPSLIVELATLRVRCEYQETEINRLKQQIEGLEGELTEKDETIETLEIELDQAEAGTDKTLSDPVVPFWQQFVQDPSKITPLLEVATPLLSEIMNIFQPRQPAQPVQQTQPKRAPLAHEKLAQEQNQTGQTPYEYGTEGR